MPTYDTLTDDPSSFPTAVRTPDGSAPRNATTEAGPLQDLANRTAWLKRRGPDHTGSILDMRGLANPQGGDDFWSFEFGHYVFRTSVTAGPEPFCYAANDGTTGRWVSPMIRLFCGQAVPSGSPAIIQSSLLPPPSYPRLVTRGQAACADFPSPGQTITTSSTWTQVNDGSADLSLPIGGTLAGDHVSFSIGPIRGNTISSAQVLDIRLRIHDGSTDYYYPYGLVLLGYAGPNNATFQADHAVVTGGTLSVYLEARVTAAGTGHLYTDGDFGPAGVQWLRYEVIR